MIRNYDLLRDTIMPGVEEFLSVMLGEGERITFHATDAEDAISSARHLFQIFEGGDEAARGCAEMGEPDDLRDFFITAGLFHSLNANQIPLRTFARDGESDEDLEERLHGYFKKSLILKARQFFANEPWGDYRKDSPERDYAIIKCALRLAGANLGSLDATGSMSPDAGAAVCLNKIKASHTEFARRAYHDVISCSTRMLSAVFQEYSEEELRDAARKNVEDGMAKIKKHLHAAKRDASWLICMSAEDVEWLLKSKIEKFGGTYSPVGWMACPDVPVAASTAAFMDKQKPTGPS